jgi:hypothetical protein
MMAEKLILHPRADNTLKDFTSPASSCLGQGRMNRSITGTLLAVSENRPIPRMVFQARPVSGSKLA